MAQKNKPGPIPIPESEILDLPSNNRNLPSCFFVLLFTYRVSGLYLTYLCSSLPSQQNVSSQEALTVSQSFTALSAACGRGLKCSTFLSGTGLECSTFLSGNDDWIRWKSECNGVSEEKFLS